MEFTASIIELSHVHIMQIKYEIKLPCLKHYLFAYVNLNFDGQFMIKALRILSMLTFD